jgi:predicted DNA-binding protein
MTVQITLNLPARLLQTARIVAEQSGRTVDAVLIEAIERGLEQMEQLYPETPLQPSEQE